MFPAQSWRFKSTWAVVEWKVDQQDHNVENNDSMYNIRQQIHRTVMLVSNYIAYHFATSPPAQG